MPPKWRVPLSHQIGGPDTKALFLVMLANFGPVTRMMCGGFFHCTVAGFSFSRSGLRELVARPSRGGQRKFSYTSWRERIEESVVHVNISQWLISTRGKSHWGCASFCFPSPFCPPVVHLADSGRYSLLHRWLFGFSLPATFINWDSVSKSCPFPVSRFSFLTSSFTL